MGGQVTNVSNTKSQLEFKNYTVDNINFSHNPNFDQEKVEIDAKINKNINYINQKSTNEETKALVTLTIDIFDNPKQNNYPFSLFVKITGFFATKETDPEQVKYTMEKSSVAILFPYIRSLISTITANANVQPLNLPPINVNQFIEEQQAEQQDNDKT